MYTYTKYSDRDTNCFSMTRKNNEQEDDDIEVSIIDDGSRIYVGIEVRCTLLPYKEEQPCTQEEFEKHFNYAKELINGIKLD